jgi:serine/threonine-protein phosphatase 4 regulatory subunit 1
VCSKATLHQEKLTIIQNLPELADEIGVRKSIEHIVNHIIPSIVRHENDELKYSLILILEPLA